MGENPIKNALRISIVYHIGSMIKGAAILAVV
jgi:hypothetical protein